jgi:preprotein translocase subunit YajC
MRTYPVIAQCANPQNGGGEQSGADSLWTLLPPFVLLIVVFYFLLIRPQRKREKERQEMIGALKKGEKVVTTGGIHGTVISIKDPWIVLKIDDNADTKMKVLKTSILGPAASFEQPEGAGSGEEKKEKK